MVVSARTKCIWHRSNQTLMHSTTAPRDLKVHFNKKFQHNWIHFVCHFRLLAMHFLIQTDVKKTAFQLQYRLA